MFCFVLFVCFFVFHQWCWSTSVSNKFESLGGHRSWTNNLSRRGKLHGRHGESFINPLFEKKNKVRAQKIFKQEYDCKSTIDRFFIVTLIYQECGLLDISLMLLTKWRTPFYSRRPYSEFAIFPILITYTIFTVFLMLAVWRKAFHLWT